MFQPRDVYQLLGVSDSTLRRWSRAFNNYLSDHARKKRRTYTQGDLATLTKVKELLDDGMTTAEILGQLPDFVVSDEEQEQETALSLPGLVLMIENMKEQLIAAADRQAELEARIAELEKPWYQRIFRRE